MFIYHHKPAISLNHAAGWRHKQWELVSNSDSTSFLVETAEQSVCSCLLTKVYS